MANIQLYRPSIVELTQEQIAELKPKFEELDNDQNGKINAAETRQFMEKIGINPIFVKLVFELCDTDCDGQITFEEFGPYLELLRSLEKDPSCVYRNVFEKFDKDHNGLLDKQEIRELLKLFSDAEWEDDNIDLFIENYDKDKDGNLNFEEVCEMINNDK
ncbi:Calmodulin-2 [Tritrichomonas musculus]|uniref:Calmodulin-2 n=1 Tax=Tritrichomonas musculus TaxID=1915356 RepID=A0ABR2J153_9EUKA